MAGRAAQVVGDEEDGRQEGRRPLQRQLQRNPEEHSKRGKQRGFIFFLFYARGSSKMTSLFEALGKLLLYQLEPIL